jgi:polysaccharide pyruvyl transferase WcaK-like protein
LLARGVPVTILTGANLLPAADEEAFANALAALAPASVRRVDARSLAEWFGAIAGAAAVVSGRFHHTIAAASMGTPFVMLGSNTPKNEGLSRMLGVASPVPLGSPRLAESLHTATVAALESAQDADSAGVPPRLADLCALAMHNFDRLPQASRPAPGGSATSGRAAAFRPI